MARRAKKTAPKVKATKSNGKRHTLSPEAKITVLACTQPPKGYARWTLRLLAEKMVELELIESISHDTVDKVLKKTNFSLI